MTHDGRPNGHRYALQVSLTAVAFWVCLAIATVIGAQDERSHAGHQQQAAKDAATRAESRPMDAQPQIGELTLINQDGQPVLLRDALTSDVPVMVNFIFTSCTTICPVMTAGFSQLEADLRAENHRVRLVSISIDPEVDTPARLREYALRIGAGAGWRFLTGTPAVVEAAQRAFGAYRGSKDNHAPATYVRRTPDAPWERLEGLASGRVLLRAYRGGQTGGLP